MTSWASGDSAQKVGFDGSFLKQSGCAANKASNLVVDGTVRLYDGPVRFDSVNG